MNLVLKCYTSKYAAFSGRASRKEYWLFILSLIIFTFIAIGIDISTGTYDEVSGYGLVSGLISLALIIPSIAVAIRRLHDTNRVGWWILLSFIPLIGQIWFIVLMCLKGTEGKNRFGTDILSSQ
jgi:uncharacterized membrane protein YhaH (DUF805 family)